MYNTFPCFISGLPEISQTCWLGIVIVFYNKVLWFMQWERNGSGDKTLGTRLLKTIF